MTCWDSKYHVVSALVRGARWEVPFRAMWWSRVPAVKELTEPALLQELQDRGLWFPRTYGSWLAPR